MKFADDPDRKRILRQALAARTLPEIAAATQELDQWLRDNPDDLGIVDAFEQLAMMQEIAEEKQAKQAGPLGEPVSAERIA